MEVKNALGKHIVRMDLGRSDVEPVQLGSSSEKGFYSHGSKIDRRLSSVATGIFSSLSAFYTSYLCSDSELLDSQQHVYPNTKMMS